MWNQTEDWKYVKVVLFVSLVLQSHTHLKYFLSWEIPVISVDCLSFLVAPLLSSHTCSKFRDHHKRAKILKGEKGGKKTKHAILEWIYGIHSCQLHVWYNRPGLQDITNKQETTIYGSVPIKNNIKHTPHRRFKPLGPVW